MFLLNPREFDAGNLDADSREIMRKTIRFFEEKGSVNSTSRIVTRDGQVVGFNMLGRRWDHTVLMRWIEERRSRDWVLRHLNEAAFDTEFVPPLRVPRA